ELAVLQRQLAAQSEAAVRTAVRGALEEAAARSDDDGAGTPGASGTGGSGAAGRGAPGGSAQRGRGADGGGAGPAGRGGGASGDASGGAITSPGMTEIDGLTDWPEMEQIPRSVSSSGPGGMEVRGHATLVDCGTLVWSQALTWS